jgi:hypothetical protein
MGGYLIGSWPSNSDGYGRKGRARKKTKSKDNVLMERAGLLPPPATRAAKPKKTKKKGK